MNAGVAASRPRLRARAGASCSCAISAPSDYSPAVRSESIQLGTVEDARELYLDIVRRSLLDAVYDHPELIPVAPTGPIKRATVGILARRGLEAVRRRGFDPARRAEGKGWPLHAHTMIGTTRLLNIQACIEEVVRDEVPGDAIETGVWRGGGSIFMRAVLRAHGVTDRIVWVADSFKGLPSPDAARYPADAGSNLHTFRSSVSRFLRYERTSSGTDCSMPRSPSSRIGLETHFQSHPSTGSRSSGSTATYMSRRGMHSPT